MKTLILILSLLSFNLSANADGFVCEGKNTGLALKVINHTTARAGTRTPAVMVVANPSVQSDRKTIALFSDENHTLTYQGRGNYLGKVDLRYIDSNRRGENIAGTKLGELKSILLDIEFSYAHGDTQLANSVDEIPAKVYYLKRNGEILEESAFCKRYHKAQ